MFIVRVGDRSSLTVIVAYNSLPESRPQTPPQSFSLCHLQCFPGWQETWTRNREQPHIAVMRVEPCARSTSYSWQSRLTPGTSFQLTPRTSFQLTPHFVISKTGVISILCKIETKLKCEVICPRTQNSLDTTYYHLVSLAWHCLEMVLCGSFGIRPSSQPGYNSNLPMAVVSYYSYCLLI